MIYFVQAKDGGPIKIGYTARGVTAVDLSAAKERLKALQTGHPYELRLTNVIEGELENEKALHQRFADARLEGEWFEPIAELAELAKARRMSIPDRKSWDKALRREYADGYDEGYWEARREAEERQSAELAEEFISVALGAGVSIEHLVESLDRRASGDDIPKILEGLRHDERGAARAQASRDGETHAFERERRLEGMAA